MCLMSQLVHSYQLGSVLSKSAGEGVLGQSSLGSGWKRRRGSRVSIRGKHTQEVWWIHTVEHATGARRHGTGADTAAWRVLRAKKLSDRRETQRQR